MSKQPPSKNATKQPPQNASPQPPLEISLQAPFDIETITEDIAIVFLTKKLHYPKNLIKKITSGAIEILQELDLLK